MITSDSPAIDALNALRSVCGTQLITVSGTLSNNSHFSGELQRIGNDHFVIQSDGDETTVFMADLKTFQHGSLRRF